MKLQQSDYEAIVKTALREDLQPNDITSVNMFPPTQRAEAKIICNSNGIIAGLPIARYVFKLLDRKCKWCAKKSDGDRVKKGTVIATISGLTRAILAGERTALNFLQHLSGVATLTDAFIRKIKNTHVGIYTTRKTLPGLRKLEKYAVVCAGGNICRMSLSDMVLIKNNHLTICRRDGLPVVELINSLRHKIPKGMKIEVEVQNLRHLKMVLPADVDIIMLDNMPYYLMKKAIKIIRQMRKDDIEIEISGNVSLKNISKLANLKIDRISVGKITHSAQSLDIKLKICG